MYSSSAGIMWEVTYSNTSIYGTSEKEKVKAYIPVHLWRERGHTEFEGLHYGALASDARVSMKLNAPT